MENNFIFIARKLDSLFIAFIYAESVEMICYKFMFILLVIPFGQTMRVNMQGAISLGKEIADTLVEYVQKKMIPGISGRRTLGSHGSSSTISIIVTSAFLCRHLQFCQEPYETFINDYTIAQTETIEAIFKNLMKNKDQNTVIFEEELKKILKEIRIYVENLNNKISEGNEISVWVELLKKISFLYKERAMAFGLDRLEGNADEMHEVKKKMQQTLVLATTDIELHYEKKLCSDHNICQKKYIATKSLYDLLDMINVLSEDKIKQFIKIFSESLTQSEFYMRVSDVTADEFRSILNDMAFSNTIETKNVFSILKETVKKRIDAIQSNQENATGKDVKLVHVILSDLDYFYSKRKSSTFEDFLTEFNEWSKSGGKLNTEVRKVMKDISKIMTVESEDLVEKLTNEVKVFMEITVDPEN